MKDIITGVRRGTEHLIADLRAIGLNAHQIQLFFADTLANALAAVDCDEQLFKRLNMTHYRCGQCKLEVVRPNPPESCPRCDSDGDFFDPISELAEDSSEEDWDDEDDLGDEDDHEWGLA